MLETHYECPCLDKCPLNYAMSIIGGTGAMSIPKTPVEFDYDLWTTEEGKCMVVPELS